MPDREVDSSTVDPRAEARAPSGPSGARLRAGIGLVVFALLVGGRLLVSRAESKTNEVAMGSSARPVSFVVATEASFRASRAYVGTLEPWVEAAVGPQLISAYVDSVLVRPGAVVKKGELLATLDCASAHADRRALDMQARAADARQRALADESARVRTLVDGGFVAPNEAERKTAESHAELAQALAAQARLEASALEVKDCALLAPFDGEVASRNVDPGAYVHPGEALVSIVDRGTVRVTADTPEKDFDLLSPGTPVAIHELATGKDLSWPIARRAPRADARTRTIHIEIDVPDPERKIPVGTTGRLRVDVGEPIPATKIPLYAASVRGDVVSIFVVDGDVARAKQLTLRGEREGWLYVDAALSPGTKVVAQGRALLADGDRIQASPEPAAPSAPSGSASARGGKGAPL